jgi:hypothetical protein
MFHPILAAECRNRISIGLSSRCGMFDTAVTAGNRGGDIQCNLIALMMT